MNLLWQYPVWFVVFCIVVAVLYTLALYFNTAKQWSKNTQILLSLLRFLAVATLCFLLLSPLVKSSFVEKKAPIIALVQDNSQSIALSFAHNQDSLQYVKDFEAMQNQISAKYQVDAYTFAHQLQAKKINFQGKSTNISSALESIKGNYFNQNLGAIILATDGVFNEGLNPIYAQFNCPVYIVALGDTAIQKDLKIEQVKANKIAYLNDKVEVQIDISAQELANQKAKLQVFDAQNKIVHQQEIKIKNNADEITTSFVLHAKKVGLQAYTAKLQAVENEVTQQNNEAKFYIDVIDARLKILLLAKAPHPNISAIKQSIAQNRNLDLKIAYFHQKNTMVEDYNLIILHHLPTAKNTIQTILQQSEKENIPLWFIAENAHFNALNNAQSMVNIQVKNKSKNDVEAVVNDQFKAFSLSEKTIMAIQKMPPLQLAFGTFKSSTATQNLLWQKIGAVSTDFPILSFAEQQNRRTGIWLGEGLWQWRLHNYLWFKNHDAFDELINKTVNFLALKADKRKFRVNSTQKLYTETEAIIIEAELYDANYQLNNTPEINLVLKNDEGKQFPLQFSRTNNAYRLATETLPVGNYTYSASTKFNQKKYTAEGVFSIKALQIEALETQANHKVLQQIVNKSGGKLFYPKELDKLSEEVLQQENITSIAQQRMKTEPIINLKWIFFLIVLFLSIEWFVRKYEGGY